MKKSIFDSAFYQFVMAFVAMLALIGIQFAGMPDVSGITHLLSSVVGAGVWGGLRAKPDGKVSDG